MFDVILPPVFGTVLCAGLLFLLSKKNNWKWILIAFGIYYVAMFAFFGDYTGLGSFSINALAYFICLPIFFIPFILHAVFKKFDSFLFTFIFPMGIVLTEYIGTLFVISPGMNIGYRFFHIKPMIQCASFIGAAGLSFILGWFLSAVVTMISRKFIKEYVITAIVSAAVVLAALTFGFIRLGNVQEPTQFVHASWATGPELSLTDGVWSKLSYERNMESFEKTSKEAYENNAELLIYAEEAFAINENKLEEFLNVAKGKAKEYNMAMLITFDIELWKTVSLLLNLPVTVNQLCLTNMVISFLTPIQMTVSKRCIRWISR